MYDSTDVLAIPETAKVAAGYVDGAFANFAAVVARTPNAQHVAITVTGRPANTVCDCETGDLTPLDAARWARVEQRAGRRPTIYCSRNLQQAVMVALASVGAAPVDWWLADWTGVPHLIPGTVATQYANDVAGCDLSLTNGLWPAPTPDPVDTGTHYDATVPGPVGVQLAVIGKIIGPRGLYRGRQVTGAPPVYAGTGTPTAWHTGWTAADLPSGAPLAVPLADAGQTSTVVSTVYL